MARFELTQQISRYLEPHLVFPLLEFLQVGVAVTDMDGIVCLKHGCSRANSGLCVSLSQEKGIYDEGDIMKAKLALLRNTNMVDFAMDIHKSLYEDSPIPQAMKERRAEVVARLRKLQQDVDPIIKCLENPNVVRNFRQDKTFNMQVRMCGGGARACVCVHGGLSMRRRSCTV
jgi:translation initiation factor 3 subunit E